MYRSTSRGMELTDFPHDQPGPVTGLSASRFTDSEQVLFVASGTEQDCFLSTHTLLSPAIAEMAARISRHEMGAEQECGT
ncbi:hypothetical protein DPX16_15784 [Anabarilius grahami]|uniref:Uncharacterized protein n=1 Tax=Anabarilius grahami TaxID=495550 RepID=A0A3N0YUT5_ANAGA|nr:hypothetical protein DPX16_15784 [Anabarilius grahami]